ncbi:uncharacterized protein LOC107039882 [Diachasma alloeum]|uniref:uncharacterized protein LOC107039882 n=1 Tax=Diachasma alloeum TaxID=454923 RepID=UPI00073816FE|nr:uncharacterized protein LOC107039882 [Diachasma alloeum]
MWKKEILVLFIILSAYQASGLIEDMLSMGKTLWKLVGKLQDVQDHFDATTRAWDTIVFNPSSDDNTEQLEFISKQISEFKTFATTHFNEIQRLLKALPGKIKIDDYEKDYRIYVGRIDAMHADLMDFLEDKKVSEWKEGKHIEEEVRKILPELAIILGANVNGEGLIKFIAEQEEHFQKSNEIEAFQQYLIQIFETIMITEMKALHLIGSSLRAQGLTPKEWGSRTNRALHRFEDRYKVYIAIMLNVLHKTSPFIRAGEPQLGRWIKDDPNLGYYEIGSFKSTFVYLHTVIGASTIGMGSETCEQGITGFWGCPNLTGEKNWCVETRGELNLCVENDNVVSATYDGLGSVKLGSRKTHGRKDSCPIDNQLFFVKVPKSPSGVPVTRCLCKCHRSSAHSISLSWSHTDVVNNKVVTGVRFIQYNRSLHIQIKQGKLINDGKVDPATESWVPLPSNPEVMPITWESKTFKLNNPTLPFGYALVGVQFDNVSGSAAIRILGKKFDMKDAVLRPGLVQVSTEPQHKFDKLTIAKNNPLLGAPTVSNKPDSGENHHFIELETAPINNDFMQPTLPFFDGIPIETNPPRALSGIGLFHKHVENYAGFISLQLRSLPFIRYVSQLMMDYKRNSLLEECNGSECRLDWILDLGRRVSTMMQELSELAYGDNVKLKLKMRLSFKEIMLKLDSMKDVMDMTHLVAVMKKSVHSSLREKVEKWAAEAKPILEQIDEPYEWFANTDMPVNFTYAKSLAPRIKEKLPDFETFLRSSLSFKSHRQDNFITAISRSSRVDKDSCRGTQSMHHILTQLFHTIIAYEVKSMIVLTYIYKVEYPHRETWSKELLEARTKFITRFTNYVKLFVKALNKFPSHIQSCDPTNADTTQGKIHIEIKESSHLSTFSYLKKKKKYTCTDAVKNEKMMWYNNQDKCPGSIDGCIPVKRVVICHKENTRTVSAWNLEKNLLYSCVEKGGKTEAHDNNKTSQNCLCTCNTETSTSVSLNFNLANSSENMVITGVKFVLQDHVLHIQIKQGQLLPHGRVDLSSNHWVDPPKKPKTITISPIHQRLIFSELSFSSDYAVTGIGFFEKNGFGLRVRAQRFNFENGTLLSRHIIKYGTISSKDDKRHNEKENVENPDDLDWVDLVPAPIKMGGSRYAPPRFNGLSVEVDPPTPIGGVEIFHQMPTKDKGFISLRLHSLNFKSNLEYFMNQTLEERAFLKGF